MGTDVSNEIYELGELPVSSVELREIIDLGATRVSAVLPFTLHALIAFDNIDEMVAYVNGELGVELTDVQFNPHEENLGFDCFWVYVEGDISDFLNKFDGYDDEWD